MRRRLTVTMVLLVACILLATGLVSYYFIERAAITTAKQQLTGQAHSISQTLSAGTALTKVGERRELNVLREAGNFAGIDVVALHPDGTFTGTFPPGVTAGDLDVAALQAGHQVSGRSGTHLIYTAVPTSLPTATRYEPVLLISREVSDPASGVGVFVLVGLVGLLLATLIAAALARRFARPLTAAAAATNRIAAGDLEANVEPAPGDDPEFRQLAASINTMAATLKRARDQERQFLLSVSHELRTPLTSIRGYADAIVDGTAEQPDGAARVIGAEARRLERLVQDLLDLARLDADRFSLDLVPVDAAGAVRQVVDGFSPGAAELGLALVTAPGSEVPLWVRADRDRLVQVLANLVENASSFARQQIVVGSGDVAGTPTLWVVDDGPGIPASELAAVFGRHFVSDRVSGRRRGSGLGLAIVAELVAAMGGTVEAQSPAGDDHGTRIVVRLERTMPRAVPGSPAAAPDAPGGSDAPELLGRSDSPRGEPGGDRGPSVESRSQ